MRYKYSILKSSWGIVIFLDMEELIDPQLKDNDIQLLPNIFFRTEENSKLKKDDIEKWARKCIIDCKSLILEKTGKRIVCFYLKEIDFNLVDFQIEGLYCAIREWLSRYYGLNLTPIEVGFDKENNKYLFNIP